MIRLMTAFLTLNCVTFVYAQDSDERSPIFFEIGAGGYIDKASNNQYIPPLASRQFTANGRQLTWAETGTNIPPVILGALRLGVGARPTDSDNWDVSGGASLVRPFGNKVDSRTSTILGGGTATLELGTKRGFGLGFYAGGGYKWIYGDFDYLPHPIESRILVNGTTVNSSEIKSYKIVPSVGLRFQRRHFGARIGPTAFFNRSGSPNWGTKATFIWRF